MEPRRTACWFPPRASLECALCCEFIRIEGNATDFRPIGQRASGVDLKGLADMQSCPIGGEESAECSEGKEEPVHHEQNDERSS